MTLEKTGGKCQCHKSSLLLGPGLRSKDKSFKTFLKFRSFWNFGVCNFDSDFLSFQFFLLRFFLLLSEEEILFEFFSLEIVLTFPFDEIPKINIFSGAKFASGPKRIHLGKKFSGPFLEISNRGKFQFFCDCQKKLPGLLEQIPTGREQGLPRLWVFGKFFPKIFFVEFFLSAGGHLQKN